MNIKNKKYSLNKLIQILLFLNKIYKFKKNYQIIIMIIQMKLKVKIYKKQKKFSILVLLEITNILLIMDFINKIKIKAIYF